MRAHRAAAADLPPPAADASSDHAVTPGGLAPEPTAPSARGEALADAPDASAVFAEVKVSKPTPAVGACVVAVGGESGSGVNSMTRSWAR